MTLGELKVKREKLKQVKNTRSVYENDNDAPLGKSHYTPWQNIRAREFSAKGIRTDSVYVAYINESRLRSLKSLL